MAGGWGEQGRQEAIRRAGAGLGFPPSLCTVSKAVTGSPNSVSTQRLLQMDPPPTHTHPMGLGEGTVMAEP